MLTMNKNYLYGVGALTASASVVALYFHINNYLDAIERARAKMAEEKERKRAQYMLVLKSAGATLAVSTIAFLGYKLKNIVTDALAN